ncbi:MAG: alanine--tRNA ligase [bacterium]|nr:alanine--tRNA ligase [bacterium]
MKANEVREQFMEYFAARGHRRVPSAPLVPADDPTLLFTNAGMNQFKDVFLGTGARDYVRAVNAQKCMRVSGKHNDLEDVGADTYHHTFFEMLGNWSFGDYYKREAIEWAWDLLTRVWRVDPGRLWATVFVRDDEAARLWPEVTGMPPGRVLRFDERENFWEMAETGPCGPCSEIHVDMGERHCRRRGEPGHRCVVNGGCGRFIEIWNLVFIQSNRNERGEFEDLPRRHVDTGMGFERLVAVLQGVDSNYSTDLFLPVIGAVEERARRAYDADRKDAVAFRAIADHARALSFAVADGAMPSNEGRGYVLRMILRRAVRYGRILGIEEPFLSALVPVVASVMGEAYPELRQHREHVSRVILSEEERFHNTLACGLEMLDRIIGAAKEGGKGVIAGDDLFRLYDTYGFPVDLARLVAGEEGLAVDERGFEALMEDQKERARAAWKAAPAAAGGGVHDEIARRAGPTVFRGHECTAADASVAALVRDGREAGALAEGEEGEIVLDETPFYAEAGGQVGDRGRIYGDGGTAEVRDTQAAAGGIVSHRVKMLNGRIGAGERVRAEVTGSARLETARSHTATHLLQNALRQVLGDHVKQAGSLVAPGRLRFDFTHFAALSPREIERVEEIVNARIRENARVSVYEMPFEEARRKDIIAIFGERYGDRVRVVDVGGYSRELCGGTHVGAAGDIGLFAVTGESSVAAGIRRIEALSGEAALHYLRRRERQVREIARLLKADPDAVVDRVEELRRRKKRMEKEAARRREEAADPDALAREARDAGGARLVAAEVAGLDPDALRGAADRVVGRLGSGVALLGSRAGGKAHLVCMVSEDLVGRGLHAGEIVGEAARAVGGRGGGRPRMAQAGGPEAERLPDALAAAEGIVARMLAGGSGKGRKK